MNQETKAKLPPNPYRRSPIKKLEDLAGRARERRAIRYYLNLTTSGDSPHLALIGQRGVGKTSLLNGAEAIAKDLKLLTVRLDMNELKAKSPGRFWHDLYQTLALSMVKKGCWGGEQGRIYEELLRMIHSRQPGSLEKAVMQIPYVFSCHQGSIDDFECPDALVVNDFKTCLSELQSKGFSGIALMIDEADCLGKNVPLLQMFRNIFQVVENCSLILAGTEAVFPALSEVFSPIPRQFHRVDVKPFARWPDTMELVLNPLPKDLIDAVAPEGDVIQELHELCGGAPDEIQLYCHHMYRSVQDGSSERMSLSPQVFREVLREYRSNTPVNVEAVLNAIERLPDKLLFQSNWLSRRNLTLEENIRVSILMCELKRDKQLSSEERGKVASELSEGYRKLFEAGIIEIDNCIRLAGAPLTAGFWKSFVEVEKGKRWSWDDDSFAENLRYPVTHAIGKACGAAGFFERQFGNNAKQGLFDLREGKAVTDIDDSMGEMIFSSLLAHEAKTANALDISFQWESPAGRQSTHIRFVEKPDLEIRRELINQWLDTHKAMLAANEISCVVTGFARWRLPTPEELHRLACIAGYSVPDVFGPTQAERAFSKFAEGDIQACMQIFSKMLADKENPQTRNNLAFCQIVVGDVEAGMENATKAVASDYEPLYELNKGIATFLLGNTEEAMQCLRNALKELRVPGNNFFSDASYVLVLQPVEKKASPHADILIESAILINLWLMGDMPRNELEATLTKLCPEKAQGWLATFPAS